MDILDKIEKFEKRIYSEQEFISSPNSYIFDMTDIEVRGEMTEYLRAIVLRNTDLLQARKSRLEQRKKELLGLKRIQLPVTKDGSSKVVEVLEEELPLRDISHLISILEHSLLDDETKKMLGSITKEEQVRLKLYFLKKMIEVKQEIRDSIAIDPMFNVNELQEHITQYQLIIMFLDELGIEKEVEVLDDVELSNIILVPDINNKNSYLYEDILRYLDSRKEIRNVLDKMMTGYFLKTKDTKMIETHSEQKLYEYKHPNGIRVLYVVSGGYIFICSIFFKDKQKSTRINSYYDDAINRYLSSLNYMQENINEVDFYIEQAEYLANINTILEQGISLQKKVGE